MRLTTLTASVLILASAQPAHAQANPAGAPRTPNAPGEIRGSLTDSASGQAVTRGSITIRRQRDTAFVSGTLPKPDGTFRVDGLLPGQYTLRFRAVGFAPVTRNDLVITAEKPVVDIGLLKLTVVATKLADQEIAAERDEEVLSPDRNVYSTKNMTTAAGGTAIDVLKNVPLVEVDQTNRVSLRNNGNVVVQINGRSTPLKGEQLGTFLAQLPANMVKHVEVATNPSAKDDPEGTAGIINIVLKQDVELGLSGGVNGGTSTTGQMSLGGNVGKQQGKFTAFISGNVYRDHRNSYGTISRENLAIPTPVFVETSLSGEQHPLSGGGSLRTEYRLNEVDAISFDAFMYGGQFDGTNSSRYTNLDRDRAVTGAFNQFNRNASTFVSQDFDLSFRRQGKPNTRQITAEIEYANNDNDNETNLSGAIVQPDPAAPAEIRTERNRTEGRYPYLTAKLDYSIPLNRTTKLETGFKGLRRRTSNDFNASFVNPATGEFEIDPERATGIDYRENIIGAYGLYSQRVAKVQLQAGLRVEDANTNFVVPSLSKTFDKEYWSLYPSTVISYNFTDLRQARISYSRRVSRPDPYQLSPIISKQDNRNIYHGNPDLGAEYANYFDLSFQEGRKWGSVQLNTYLRRTDHAVRSIQTIDSTGVTVRTFENLANTTTMGSDLNVNYRRGPLQLYLSGSASRYKSDASNISRSLSAQDIIWSTRANGTWKFSPLFDMQIFANYRAPYKTEGGSSRANANVAGSVRYKVWGDKGNITLRVSDPFKIQKSGYRTATASVLEWSERYNGSRAVYLSVSRNFGQALRLRPKNDPDIPQGPPGG
ncbi:MAG TPA: TonB-dependent receptor [Gemmatimonadaceae bacterium]